MNYEIIEPNQIDWLIDSVKNVQALIFLTLPAQEPPSQAQNRSKQ